MKLALLPSDFIFAAEAFDMVIKVGGASLSGEQSDGFNGIMISPYKCVLLMAASRLVTIVVFTIIASAEANAQTHWMVFHFHYQL